MVNQVILDDRGFFSDKGKQDDILWPFFWHINKEKETKTFSTRPVPALATAHDDAQRPQPPEATKLIPSRAKVVVHDAVLYPQPVPVGLGVDVLARRVALARVVGEAVGAEDRRAVGPEPRRVAAEGVLVGAARGVAAAAAGARLADAQRGRGAAVGRWRGGEELALDAQYLLHHRPADGAQGSDDGERAGRVAVREGRGGDGSAPDWVLDGDLRQRHGAAEREPVPDADGFELGLVVGQGRGGCGTKVALRAGGAGAGIGRGGGGALCRLFFGGGRWDFCRQNIRHVPKRYISGSPLVQSLAEQIPRSSVTRRHIIVDLVVAHAGRKGRNWWYQRR